MSTTWLFVLAGVAAVTPAVVGLVVVSACLAWERRRFRRACRRIEVHIATIEAETDRFVETLRDLADEFDRFARIGGGRV